ncbi:MAG: hypothetical protein HY543_05530, partial [Deltaproteobacteria bacterium]|nr:hypothetical protein [Deltaproteobacteria bacterium]
EKYDLIAKYATIMFSVKSFLGWKPSHGKEEELDVTDIGTVINYDLPDNSGDYVHRIGRTGRAGREGKAISFATPDQKGNVLEIERLIRKTLKLVSKYPMALPAFPPASALPSRPAGSAHARGGAAHRGGHPRRGSPFGAHGESGTRGWNARSKTGLR